jgi:hypothetical protein
MKLQAQIDHNTVVLGEVNIPPSPINQSSFIDDQQSNFRATSQIIPDGHIRYLQSSPHNKQATHILFCSS